MALPDITAMKALPAAEWRAFGERLAAVGLDGTSLAACFDIAKDVGDPPRDLLVTWHLRQRHEPAAWGARMFYYRDPIAEDQARAVLGARLVATMLDVGLLVRSEGGIASSLFVMPGPGGFFVAFDELSAGQDSAMGFGMTTIELCRAASPSERLESALDLGCGAGFCALALASRVDRVVGTDINVRAVELARINAAINGITNVEFMAGDLFEPVAGETFDVVVSQPPFVARPEGAEDRTYLYGGSRGDELALRLLSQVRRHLTPRGRAVVLIEFPEIDASPLEARIRDAMADPGASVLLLQSAQNVDDDSASYALAEHRGVGEGYVRTVLARRTHFEKLGVTGLKLSFTVVEHAKRAPGWIEAVPIEFGAPEIGFTDRRLASIVRAFDAIAAGRDSLLAAKLAVPEGTRFVESPDAGEITARLPDTMLRPLVTLNRDSFEIAAKVSAAPTVRDGIEVLAKRDAMTPSDAIDNIVPAVETLLRCGLLEVV